MLGFTNKYSKKQQRKIVKIKKLKSNILKKTLIDKLLKFPEKFTRKNLDLLLNGDEKNHSKPVNNEDLKNIFLRIYDLNDTVNLGEAHTGLMGFLNRRSNKKRNKKFDKRLKKDVNRKKIYAEGDSWFQHPLINDIIDYLNKFSKKYAIYSSAMGGEWWINIIEKGDYISELSNIKPDVILLSGAGNDIVGGKKISNLVNPEKALFKSLFSDVNANNLDQVIKSDDYLKNMISLDHINGLSDIKMQNNQKEMLIYGLSVLSVEFFSLMWAFELMYKYLIKNIRKKFKDIQIITQGYDYPIPSYKKGFLPKKLIINRGMHNGHWLADALNRAGIKRENQKAVTFSLIYFFNEVLVRTANEDINLYHIDSRDAAKGKIQNWYDEMHVKPKIFKKIAKTYIDCIESDSQKSSVFKVK